MESAKLIVKKSFLKRKVPKKVSLFLQKHPNIGRDVEEASCKLKWWSSEQLQHINQMALSTPAIDAIILTNASKKGWEASWHQRYGTYHEDYQEDLNTRGGPLFAYRISYQLPCHVARYPNLGSIATDAFLQDWGQWMVFIHASTVLLPQILQQL